MAPVRVKWPSHPGAFLRAHLGDMQNKNAYYLIGGNLVNAAAGLAFWFLLAAILRLPPAMIGLGYAIFATGTIVGVIAKGGLDTALVRSVPEAGRQGGFALMGFAMLVGCAAALVVSMGIAAGVFVTGATFGFGAMGWALVVVIGVLLVVTWLQDAYFIGEGDAKFCFHRNAVLSATRLVLPIPVLLLALPHPVAMAWALALGFSAVAAFAFTRRLPARTGTTVTRVVFIKRSLRNVTGTAAEFLPGFLLVPIILVVSGPEAAGYFGIAWTAASLLFLASAAIGRSALSEMVRWGATNDPASIRKGVRQHLWLLAPAAVAGVVFAPQILSLFGTAYAREAAGAFMVLCASILFVAPTYLYLAYLRAHDRTLMLTLFPFAMMAVLFALAPAFAALYGLTGVAAAWFVANVPFGLYGGWKLLRNAREVIGDHDAEPAPHPNPE